MMSKSGGTLIGVAVELACIGGVPLGCFCSSNCQVSGVLGANLDDVKIWHAFEYRPSLARGILKSLMKRPVNVLGSRSQFGVTLR